jgi:hypothetical protein
LRLSPRRLAKQIGRARDRSHLRPRRAAPAVRAPGAEKSIALDHRDPRRAVGARAGGSLAIFAPAAKFKIVRIVWIVGHHQFPPRSKPASQRSPRAIHHMADALRRRL